MPIDETKLNDLPGRFVTDPGGTGHVTATERSHPSPNGIWTIDPADSRISLRMSQAPALDRHRSAARFRDHPP